MINTQQSSNLCPICTFKKCGCPKKSTYDVHLFICQANMLSLHQIVKDRNTKYFSIIAGLDRKSEGFTRITRAAALEQAFLFRNVEQELHRIQQLDITCNDFVLAQKAPYLSGNKHLHFLNSNKAKSEAFKVSYLMYAHSVLALKQAKRYPNRELRLLQRSIAANQ